MYFVYSKDNQGHTFTTTKYIYVSGATHVFCFFLKSLTSSQHNLEYAVCRYGFIFDGPVISSPLME